MPAVGGVDTREERPAYVRFERRAEKDHVESRKHNKVIDKNQDYALVTPPYSKDMVEFKIERWFETMEADVRSGRFPQEWLAKYREMYRLWTLGEELPVDGTPIKGWGVLTPAEQTNIIRTGIRTVEDLAAANDEGMRRIGMGAVDYRNKAAAWLRTLNDRGPLTTENAALKQQLAIRDSETAALKKRIEELQRLVLAAEIRMPVHPAPPSGGVAPDISAEDILDDRI